MILLNSCKSNSTQPILPVMTNPEKSNVEWLKGYPSNGGYGRSVATDNEGNSYVVGYGNLISDSLVNSSTPFGNTPSFLMKYDPNGNVLWVKYGSVRFNGVVVDEQDNILTGGEFPANSSISSKQKFSQDATLLKFNKDGDLLWSKFVLGSIWLMKRNKNGIVCMISSPASLTKISSDGDVIFTIPFINTNYSINDFDIDQDDEICLTGRLFGSGVFGNITLTSTSAKDFYVAKYDATGNCIWAKNYGYGINKYDSYGYNICFDNHKKIIVVGMYENDYSIEGYHFISTGNYNSLFMICYDNAGNAKWAKNIGGSPTSVGSMLIDNENNIYLSNGFWSNLTFFPIDYSTITPGAFIAKLDTMGNGVWVEIMKSNYSPFIFRLSLNNNNDVFVTGEYQNDLYAGSNSLSGNSTFFLAKIKAH